MNMYQKGFVNIIIVLVVVLAGVLGYVALVKKPTSIGESQPNDLQNVQQDLPPTSNNTGTSVNQKPIPPSETADWKPYRNEKFSFGFKYPKSAKLTTLPENTMILSHTEIEFEKEGSFYNRATIAFFVYPKGVFRHYPQSNNKCKIYQRSTKIIGGKTASIVEQSDCPGGEGSPTGGSGHTLTAIISLSGTEELVYTANLNNSFISQNNFGTKVLNTLDF